MPFNNEKDFEKHIRMLIQKFILPLNDDLILLQNKKAVDMVLCRNGVIPALYFVEIKYHKDYRLGTGHGKGGGFQPEILKKEFDYFERNMRWILGDMKHENAYWFADNATIRKYLAGDEIADKYNNIQSRFFKEEPKLTEPELILALAYWLQLAG